VASNDQCGARNKPGALGYAAIEPHLKLAVEVQWVQIPPGKGCHPPESSLAGVGKAEAGSVDRVY